MRRSPPFSRNETNVPFGEFQRWCLLLALPPLRSQSVPNRGRFEGTGERDMDYLRDCPNAAAIIEKVYALGEPTLKRVRTPPPQPLPVALPIRFGVGRCGNAFLRVRHGSGMLRMWMVQTTTFKLGEV